MAKISKFVQGYVDAALWTTTDDDDNSLNTEYGVDNFNPKSLEKIVADCTKFQRANQKDLNASGLAPDYQGHNFWLSRNGHGTGFWDRGLGAVGDKLHQAAKKFGETSVYVGQFGELYVD